MSTTGRHTGGGSGTGATCDGRTTLTLDERLEYHEWLREQRERTAG